MTSSTDLLTPGEIATYYAARTPSLKQQGPEWHAGCFVHGGKDLNFAVKAETGEWYCHSQCNRGGSVYDLEMELTGAAFREAAAEVRQIIGRADHRSNGSVAALSSSRPTKLSPWSKKFLEERIRQTMDHESLEFVAAYRYHRADGRFAWAKIRFVDGAGNKTFRCWAISRKGGWVSPSKAGVPPLLYRLPEVLAAEEIDLVNGEKAADSGANLGRVTTCAPNGEGNWEPEFTKFLTGKKVNIFVDNDDKGRQHGKSDFRTIVRDCHRSPGS